MFNIRDAVEKIKKLDSEQGQIFSRPSFLQTRKMLVESALSGEDILKKLSLSLTPDILIIVPFILSEDFSERQKLCGYLIDKTAVQQIDSVLPGLEKIPNILSAKILEAFLHSEPLIAGKAAYLLARLSLNVGPEKLFELIISKSFSENDLINLSILLPRIFWEDVLAGWRLKVKDIPEESKKRINDFLRILDSKKELLPVRPDLKSHTEVLSDKKKSLLSEGEGTIISKNLESFSIRNFFSLSNLPYFFLILSFIILLWSLHSLYVTTSQINEFSSETSSGRSNYLVSAVSKRVITQSFMMADREFRTGEFYRNNSSYSEALSYYKAALSICPEHKGAREKAAQCLFSLQDYGGLDKHLIESLKMFPDSAFLHFIQAKLFEQKNEFEQALYEYEQTYNLSKNNPEYVFQYAKLLHKLGEFKKSKAKIEELLSRYPENPIFLDYLEILDKDIK
ncbi:MAG: hypothetical protein HQM10_07115 [Candidatus Riflebacteria bacterium]|nr:hypothetical protein [Candidatus Riflebacteria bacterium]